jgi:uncharacterized membrane protein YccC
MAAVLASYASALALEHAAHLGISVVVLAVVLALTLSRTQRDADRTARLEAVVEVPLIALVASEVGRLLIDHPDVADALFVLALSGSIWVRRFGWRATRAGTLIALPFIALLTTPVPPRAGVPDRLWTAVVALIPVLWVTVAQMSAIRLGLLPAVPDTHHPHRPARRPGQIPASTKMALQMAVALGAAFAVGRIAFDRHWPWVVITAFIVCSGNRGRGDVAYKSAQRLGGALAGTVLATVLDGATPAGGSASVLGIFAVLAIGSWLRPFAYGFWAAAVTGALSLLYGYFGESGSGVLLTRLEGIVIGAALGLLASWFVLPVRTRDVLRRRLADALAELSGFLSALGTEPHALGAHRIGFEGALAQLEQIAPPLRVHRRIGGRGQAADAIDALGECRGALAELAGASPGSFERLAPHVNALARRVGAMRRALRDRESPELRELPARLSSLARLAAEHPDV